MTIRYLKPGEALDYTNTTNATINVNDVVVIGAMIAVAAVNILPGQTGTVLCDGAFTLPKKPAVAIPNGSKVTWSVADGGLIVGAGVTGDVANCGITIEADAAAGATAVRVKLVAGMGAAVP